MSGTLKVTVRLPEDLRDLFDALVADAHGEFRRKSLARLVAEHLFLFATLRHRGASWAQIATLLTESGITSGNGAFADVLRATYAREARSDATPKRQWTVRNAAKRGESNRSEQERGVTQRDAVERAETKPEEAPDDASTATPRMQGEAASTPPRPPRTSAARNEPGERNPDPNEHGLADLFRRAAFLHNAGNRR